MRAAYFLTCDHAVTEPGTLKNDFRGVFDKIRIPTGRDSVRPNFCLAGRIVELIAGTRVRVAVSLTDPDGDPVAIQDPVIEGTPDETAVNVIFNLNAEFSKEGPYRFEVTCNGDLLVTPGLALGVARQA